jgi:A/G-specific adenine glycosylase
VSEIMLQQTRAAAVIPYYGRFMAELPTVFRLAACDEEKLLKLWEGLGYYSRARNLKKCAEAMVREYGGRFPKSVEELKRLPGIGPYTAGAIASIAFGLPHPAVDGNVLRFVARYQGIFDNIAAPATRKLVETTCQKWIPNDRPGDFNQAMMEMGAMMCTPKNPDCPTCPFASECYAFQHQQVEQLPVKQKTVTVKNRYFHYLIFLHNDQTLVQRRAENDIWRELYEFPLVELDGVQFDIINYLNDNKIEYTEKPSQVWQTQHQLTHRRIFAYFYVVSVKCLPPCSEHQQIVPVGRLRDYAVAKVTERAIQRVFQQ